MAKPLIKQPPHNCLLNMPPPAVRYFVLEGWSKIFLDFNACEVGFKVTIIQGLVLQM